MTLTEAMAPTGTLPIHLNLIHHLILYWRNTQPPQRRDLCRSGRMQWVVGVAGFGVARSGVVALDHAQAGLFDPAQQLLARAQAQSLGQIRHHQPALAAFAKMRAQVV